MTAGWIGLRSSERGAEDGVRALVEARIEGPVLGLLGEPRVNVLLLNLALDKMVIDQAGRAMDEDG
jgi:potassium-transporting ATPase KdpC subunit